MKNKTRRKFLKSAAISTTGLLAARSLPLWARTSATTAITPPLSIFGYSKVQLLDGPFRTQFDQNHKLLLNLDEDGLLKPFRKRQGMPAPGPDLLACYNNPNHFTTNNNFHSFIPCHSS